MSRSKFDRFLTWLLCVSSWCAGSCCSSDWTIFHIQHISRAGPSSPGNGALLLSSSSLFFLLVLCRHLSILFVSEWLDWSILRSTGQQGWGLTEAGIFPNWNCLKKVRVKSIHFWVENHHYKITTFLLITMINYFKAEGLTAIECWVIACIIFVFGALLEYTVILLKLKLKKVPIITTNIIPSGLRIDWGRFLVTIFPLSIISYSTSSSDVNISNLILNCSVKHGLLAMIAKS